MSERYDREQIRRLAVGVRSDLAMVARAFLAEGNSDARTELDAARGHLAEAAERLESVAGRIS